MNVDQILASPKNLMHGFPNFHQKEKYSLGSDG